MKKKRFLSLLVFAPLALVTACSSGTTAVTLSSNWYQNTANKAAAESFKEELVYSVSYEADDENAPFQVHYSNGIYKTTFFGTNYDIKDAEGNFVENANVYCLQTELTVDVRFSLYEEQYPAASEPALQDKVTSTTYFMDVKNNLRPLKTELVAQSHTPDYLTAVPEKIEYGFLYYHVKRTVDYSVDGKTATFVQENLEPAEGEEEYAKTEYTVKMKSGVFFENDMIVFGLRAVDPEDAFSFLTIDTLHPDKTVKVNCSAADEAEENYTFALGDESAVERKITTKTFTMGLGKSPSGQSQTLTYAARTSTDANKYRNVLIKLVAPKADGSMVYLLKQAKFSN